MGRRDCIVSPVDRKDTIGTIKVIPLSMTMLSLAGQPLHKREEGSGIMRIRELFQCIAVTRRVQNHTRI
jgi:hypothetical protein